MYNSLFCSAPVSFVHISYYDAVFLVLRYVRYVYSFRVICTYITFFSTYSLMLCTIFVTWPHEVMNIVLILSALFLREFEIQIRSYENLTSHRLSWHPILFSHKVQWFIMKISVYLRKLSWSHAITTRRWYQRISSEIKKRVLAADKKGEVGYSIVLCIWN